MPTLSGHPSRLCSEAPSSWHPGLLGGPLVLSCLHWSPSRCGPQCVLNAYLLVEPGLLLEGYLDPIHHDAMGQHQAWQRAPVTRVHQTALDCVPGAVTAAMYRFTIFSLTFLISKMGAIIGNLSCPLTSWQLQLRSCCSFLCPFLICI